MEDMMPKVKYLRHAYPLMNIEVDGGVGPKTIDACAKVKNDFRIRLRSLSLSPSFRPEPI